MAQIIKRRRNFACLSLWHDELQLSWGSDIVKHVENSQLVCMCQLSRMTLNSIPVSKQTLLCCTIILKWSLQALLIQLVFEPMAPNFTRTVTKWPGLRRLARISGRRQNDSRLCKWLLSHQSGRRAAIYATSATQSTSCK